MSDTDESLVRGALNDILLRNPKMLEDAKNHKARVDAAPVEVPRQPSPEEVRAEIARLSGRAPLTADEQRDLNRDGELARKAEEYQKELAKREHDEAANRVQEFFRSFRPEETGGA